MLHLNVCILVFKINLLKLNEIRSTTLVVLFECIKNKSYNPQSLKSVQCPKNIPKRLKEY